MLDSEAGPLARASGQRRRVLELSEVTALPTASGLFRSGGGHGHGHQSAARRKALDQLDKFEKGGFGGVGGGGAGGDKAGAAVDDEVMELNLVEDEADYDDVEDHEYEDDEDGDYNAEAALDGGDNDGDDYGDDGDEATY